MTTYLLTWNPKRWQWKSLQNAVKYLQTHGHLSDRWSCGRTRKILPYDRLFFIRLGREPRGICASGWATSGVYENRHWDEKEAAKGKTALYVDFEYDVLLDSDEGDVLPRERLNDGVFAKVHWDTQASGILIPDDVAKQLETEWKRFHGRAHTRGMKIANQKIHSKYKSLLQFSEGEVTEVTVELRKRNPMLRVQAIAEYGESCQVCGFNFGEYYGELGEGYIEVHHLKPLSVRKQEHTATVEAVAVVCANCHRVLHRNGKKPIALEMLKKAIKHNK